MAVPNYQYYVSFIGLANDDSLSGASFGSETGALVTTAGASGDVLSVDATISSGNLGGLAAGKHCFIKVRRDGADGSDSATDDALLLGIELYYDKA